MKNKILILFLFISNLAFSQDTLTKYTQAFSCYNPFYTQYGPISPVNNKGIKRITTLIYQIDTLERFKNIDFDNDSLLLKYSFNNYKIKDSVDYYPDGKLKQLEGNFYYYKKDTIQCGKNSFYILSKGNLMSWWQEDSILIKYKYTNNNYLKQAILYEKGKKEEIRKYKTKISKNLIMFTEVSNKNNDLFIYTYLKSGQLISFIHFDRKSKDIFDQDNYYYNFDYNSNKFYLTEFTRIRFEKNVPYDNGTTIYFYDKNHHKIQDYDILSHSHFNFRTNYYYDSKGNLCHIIGRSYDSPDKPSYIIIYKYTYEYW